MAADDERIRCNVEDGVADVRLARPAKLNALDPAMFASLVDVPRRLAERPDVRAVVLSGEGAAFCAGLDLASFAAIASGGQGLVADLTARTHGIANLYQQAALAWRNLPVPVIAALHGAVFGGGLQVALGADIRFAAPDAKLSVMEIRWGIVPDMAGTWLMRELVRADVARELIYTGRVISGSEATALGLATRIEADPLAAALATAREIANRNPDAIRAAKRLMSGEACDAETQLRAESREQAAILGSPNQREAVRAALEKRPPVFRDPEGVAH